MATRSTPTATSGQHNYTGPFIIITALYLVFGFITTLNMQLVPHLKSVFDLPWFQASLANFAFFTAYFVVSSPTSKLIEVIGYKRTIVVSLFVQVIGALLFIPAASLPNFWLFLCGIFIIGSGVAMLQTAANPYVTALGPEHSAPFRLTLAQTFNSIGTLLAPMVASAVILKHSQPLSADAFAKLEQAAKIAYQVGVASTVKVPYLILAGALVLLGLAVSFLNLPAITKTQEFRPAKEGDPLLSRSIWTYRHTVFAAIGIFLYVGVEVGMNQFIIGYLALPQIVGFTPAQATNMLSIYWGGMLAGRILGSLILTKFKAGPLLGICGTLGVLSLVIAIFTTGHVAMYAVLATGLCNSIMFPNIFALGVAGLGPMTSKGSGLITTAVVGGALVPVLLGKLTDNFGFNIAALLPIACYLFIAYFGYIGHKQRKTA